MFAIQDLSAVAAMGHFIPDRSANGQIVRLHKLQDQFRGHVLLPYASYKAFPSFSLAVPWLRPIAPVKTLNGVWFDGL